jgi:hypothetical protein
MVRNQPNRHKPFAKRQFRVLKNGSDFDRKPLAAIAAFERLMIRKMINSIASAMRAKLTIAPTNRLQMIHASLFVRESFHKVKKAVEILDHLPSPSI